MTHDRANIESLLPLVPLQKALLLRRGQAGEGRSGAVGGVGGDPGLLHVQAALRGPVDVERLRGAFEAVIARHPALRTSIHAREGADPLAVVWRRVETPWAVEDWRGRDAARHERDLARLLADDRGRGLEVDRPPVMRVTVLRVADDRCELVWTCHHLFLDGWSAAIALDEVVRADRALAAGGGGGGGGGGAGGSPPPAAPAAATALRAYHAWLREQDDAAAASFWRERLAGFAGSPPLRLEARAAAAGGGRSGDAFEPIDALLDAALPAAIRAAATSLGLTPNALVQGAWALVLGRLFGADDVVFGTTVSGRAAGVDGLEAAVGLFANVVPVRVRIDGDAAAGDWLRSLRDRQFEMQPHEHVAAADVHAWSDVPGHRPLFETFVVVENFLAGAGAAATAPGGGIVLEDFRSSVTSSFPLTLAVVPASPWRVHGLFDRTRLDAAAARALVACFERALAALAAGPARRVAEVRGELETVALPALAGSADAADRSRPAVPAAPASAPAEAGNGRVAAGGAADAVGAPRDETELRLVRIWEEHLGVSGLGVHDDYFALGGTSLAAVRLFARLEAEFGRTLPISTLLRGATIAHLAGALRGDGETSAAWRCLVPIRTSGRKPPLACVHAGGAHVVFYRDLARRLGPDQPVYGLEPVGLDGREQPLDTIEAMAARYVEELRAAQPRGPYRLVGYCIGGTVCLEMARRLEAQGETVDLFAVIDSGLAPPEARTVPAAASARRILRRQGPAALLRVVGRTLVRPARQRLEQRLGGADARRRVSQERVERACRRAFLSYEPRPCRAPILLIRSTEFLRTEAKEWHLEWRKYTSRLDVAVVEAGHETILLEPEVAGVARLLEEMGDGVTA